jgi:deferrochelatase/peroxidase EfeB
MTEPRPTGLNRRSFLTGAAGVGAVASLGGLAACTSEAKPAGAKDAGAASPRYVPFFGPHQTGITAAPVPALGLLAAFTVVADDRAALTDAMKRLSEQVRSLMAGDRVEERPPAFPPLDSGILGPKPPPDNLAIVVSVGASLFDQRYGLADRKPVELVTMPFLANDRLDPARSHGDLLVSIEAERPDTLQFAVRQIMRSVRDALVLAWMVDGYTRGSAPADGSQGAPRNLMGFKDGTANLPTTDDEQMDRYVWVAEGDGEPAWAVGGSYHVVRVIRMFVEFWDRTRLSEQEAIMGRHKVSGAPLGQADELDIPAYAEDPTDMRVPMDAHIRLANPRTPESEANLILRRGFSYTGGFDAAGQLDQGLAFVSYQRSLEQGFLAVQARLSGEPLEEYILPEGGGFFFALPGVRDESGFLGEGLLA